MKVKTMSHLILSSHNSSSSISNTGWQITFSNTKISPKIQTKLWLLNPSKPWRTQTMINHLIKPDHKTSWRQMVLACSTLNSHVPSALVTLVIVPPTKRLRKWLTPLWAKCTIRRGMMFLLMMVETLICTATTLVDHNSNITRILGLNFHPSMKKIRIFNAQAVNSSL